MHKESITDIGLSRTEIEHLIDEWIFNERNRKILKRRNLDGITFDQLAYEFDMSVRQLKNIVTIGNRILMTRLLICTKDARVVH